MRSVVIRLSICQPTMRREYKSITMAIYIQLSAVFRYVISPAQTSFTATGWSFDSADLLRLHHSAYALSWPCKPLADERWALISSWSFAFFLGQPSCAWMKSYFTSFLSQRRRWSFFTQRAQVKFLFPFVNSSLLYANVWVLPVHFQKELYMLLFPVIQHIWSDTQWFFCIWYGIPLIMHQPTVSSLNSFLYVL